MIPVEPTPEPVDEPTPIGEPEPAEEPKPIDEPKPIEEQPVEEVFSAIDTEPVEELEKEIVEDKPISIEDILMPGPVIFEPEIEKEQPEENIAPKSPDTAEFDKLLEERLKEVEQNNYDMLVAEEVEEATKNLNAELVFLRE